MVIFLRILRTGWTGFRRHGWLSILASFIMAQALIIITLFAALNVVIGGAIENINQKLDLAVYFQDQASPEQILAVKDELMQDSRVVNITYISKEEAQKRYAEQNKSNQQLVDIVNEDSSILPASLEVRVKDPYQIEGVVDAVVNGGFKDLVRKTSFSDNQELIKSLRGMSSFVQRMTVMLGLVFVVLALLIIFNTIRITIFARKREIEIMKLVGATDWYIRWPFLFEGMAYGVAATAISLVALSALYFFIVAPLIAHSLGSIQFASSNFLNVPFVLELAGVQLVIALVVGVISSYWATLRYLRV
jgi:cell division transport system permease protein